MFKWSRRSIWNTYFIDFLSKFIGVLDKQNYREVHLKRLALGKFDCQLRLIKIISTHVGKIGTTSSWWFEICNFQIFHCPNSEISSLNWLFELSKLKISFFKCNSSSFNLAFRFVIFKVSFVRLGVSNFVVCDLQSKRLLPVNVFFVQVFFFKSFFSFHEFFHKLIFFLLLKLMTKII